MRIIAFFFLLISSLGYLGLEVSRRFQAVKLGRPEKRSDRALERWKYVFTQVLLHKKIRKHHFFGLMHGFMMWGFLFLLFSSLEMALTGLFQVRIHWLGDNIVYLFLRNLFLVLVVVGVMGSLWRRILTKPYWMHNSPMSFVILVLILVIVGSEGFYYAAQTILGEGISFTGGAWPAIDIIQLFWWIHFLGIFAFFFIIPRSKHLHLIFAPFNTYWHSLAPQGALMPVFNSGEKGEINGVSKPEDFTWKQLLDAFSCVKCGRCHGSCPAFQTSAQLRLKKLNGRLRTHLENKAPLLLGMRAGNTAAAEKSSLAPKSKPTNIENSAFGKPYGEGENRSCTCAAPNNYTFLSAKKLVAGVFEAEALWSCTTCGACEEACPVSCEHIAKIIDMRRYLVSSAENIAPEIQAVFRGIENWGNPWGRKRHRQTEYTWAQELGIPTLAEKPAAEYLYFVGCTPSTDPSARKTAIAFAKILKKAGIDFAILGEEELCCGETARRLGNELLFRATAAKNIAGWHKYGVKKIITTCPHCYNTLHSEYPQFGGDFAVIPHVALLAGLLREGKLKPEKYQKRTVTYHDSCYLGRYYGFYQEPREILQAIPGVTLVEMPRTREDSFCCGAGGGLFWLKSKSGQEITNQRVAEAQATGGEIIATACPYCRIALREETGRQGLEQEINTMDIVEILGDGLEH